MPKSSKPKPISLPDFLYSPNQVKVKNSASTSSPFNPQSVAEGNAGFTPLSSPSSERKKKTIIIDKNSV